MKRLITLASTLFLLGFSCAARSEAEDLLDRARREPLHSLTHVCISDIVVDDDIVKDGLDKEAIKISVENKLRVAGLKIDPLSSMFFTPFETRPQEISIEIESLRVKGEPMYCYDIRFEVTNYAVLVQDKSVSQGFTVWEQHVLGYVGTSRLTIVKDNCDNFADKFVNDWLKAKDETPGIYPKATKQ